MIDMTRLEIFISAAESLSFSEAAKRMNLTQPTISHHIKALESELGIILFERSGNSLKLTESGKFLLPWARKLVRQAVTLEDLILSLNEKIVGHLRIACSTTAGKYLLPRFAARFRQQHPGVRVSILRCMPEYIIPRLLEGEANLGVVSCETDGSGLEIQPFFKDSISLIVPADHPWAFVESVAPESLINEPIIIREASAGTRRVLFSELAKHDITLDDLNIFLELGSAEAIVDTVAAGYGISFVSRLATECMIRNKDVVEVAINGMEFTRTIFMVRREISVPNRAQEVFWGFIHSPENTDLLQLAEPSKKI